MMKKLFFAFLLIIASTFFLQPIFARAQTSASINITVSKAKPLLADTFTATISVDGGGQSFTTFGADVTLNNLEVIDLTKGESVGQWTTEPSAESLNFYGGVVGSVTNVDVYTLTLRAKALGAASIKLTNGSVLSTDGYNVSEILKTATDANLTIVSTVAESEAVDQAADESGSIDTSETKSSSAPVKSTSTNTFWYLIVGGVLLIVVIIVCVWLYKRSRKPVDLQSDQIVQ